MSSSEVFPILITLGAILSLLILIIKIKLHAFFALISISLLTGLIDGLNVNKIIDVLLDGFSSTIGDVALLVGFGAVLGRLIEVSGGAQVLSDKMVKRFGEEKAPFALGLASLFYAFPIFLDAGFVVMLPIIYTVARRLTGGFMLYVLPPIGAFLAMHALTPPHPGPTAVASVMHADIGIVMIVGILIAIPTFYLGGYKLGVQLSKYFPKMPVPNLLGEPTEIKDEEKPNFWTVIILLILPLILIFSHTIFSALQEFNIIKANNLAYQITQLIGETPIALMITAILAMILLFIVPKNRDNTPVISDLVDDSLAPVCSIILITGAGGAFGAILTEIGVGKIIAHGLDSLGLPIIVAAYLIAAAFRIAQGSATVAATTAGSVIAPVVVNMGLPSIGLAALVVAVGAGSIGFSHVNDSGFWLIGRFCGFTTQTTLKSWTVISTVVSLIGFTLSSFIYAISLLWF